MSTVAIELTPAQTERLAERARRLGVDPQELIEAAIADLLAEPDDAFDEAAERVLAKNEELYRRLA